MHAQTCPLCGGAGKIITGSNMTAPLEKTCHGCGGKGWVEVSDSVPHYQPIPIPYVPSARPWESPFWCGGTEDPMPKPMKVWC